MLDWPAALDTAPHAPGVYTYTDTHGKILYIGKAKDLRKRLAHYATARGADKTTVMLERAHAVAWVVTRTEVEALLLEANRIRTEKPPYNIDLKENVRYAHLRLTAEDYPRLITVRDPHGVPPKDLFGPFADGAARAELARLARKLFRLRVCRTMPKRVCLYYPLGLCSGPCEGKITADAYTADVERARRRCRDGCDRQPHGNEGQRALGQPPAGKLHHGGFEDYEQLVHQGDAAGCGGIAVLAALAASR